MPRCPRAREGGGRCPDEARPANKLPSDWLAAPVSWQRSPPGRAAQTCRHGRCRCSSSTWAERCCTSWTSVCAPRASPARRRAKVGAAPRPEPGAGRARVPEHGPARQQRPHRAGLRAWPPVGRTRPRPSSCVPFAPRGSVAGWPRSVLPCAGPRVARRQGGCPVWSRLLRAASAALETAPRVENTRLGRARAVEIAKSKSKRRVRSLCPDPGTQEAVALQPCLQPMFLNRLQSESCASD